jgi:hypothetical protein
MPAILAVCIQPVPPRLVQVVKFITLLWSTKAQVGAVTLGCTDCIRTVTAVVVVAHLVVVAVVHMVGLLADQAVDWVIKTISP